jgi:hypothetical protein
MFYANKNNYIIIDSVSNPYQDRKRMNSLTDLLWVFVVSWMYKDHFGEQCTEVMNETITSTGSLNNGVSYKISAAINIDVAD